MTDPNAPVATPETAATAAPSSPSAPAVVPSSAPVAVAAAEAPLTSAPSESAAAPIETPVPAADPTTLLGTELKKSEPVKAPEIAPAAVEAPVEPTKEEAPQSAEPAPLPTYEAFTFPDGITMDEAKLGEFTKDLGELQNLTKADQAEMQKFGQKLVDRHIAEVKESVNRVADLYQQAWDKQKNDWKDEFEKNPDIGGANREKTLNSAIQFIRTHGGSTDEQREFNELMEKTGLGNNPVMIRLLAKAGTAMSEGKPLPATRPVPSTQSKVDRRYKT